MTPDIIQAEVIEVPRPRPEVYLALAWSPIWEWYYGRGDTPAEAEKHFTEYNGMAPELIVKIPGTAAPAPEPATDAVDAVVIDNAICWLQKAAEYARAGFRASAIGAIEAAMERLAKIRGGR
jgi:hypothetical protein